MIIIHTRVVIVGGGILGAALSYYLAESGFTRILLLEKSRIGAGATGQSAGMIRVYHPDPLLADLSLEGMSTYTRFEEQMGQGCGFVKTGALYLEPPERTAWMRHEVQRLQNKGCAIRVLDREQGKKRYPFLNWNNTGGAVYEPEAGFADPAAAARLWVEAAQKQGVEVRENVKVKKVLAHRGAVTGVWADRLGTLSATVVVLASGAWSKELLETVPSKDQDRIRTKAIQLQTLHRDDSSSGHPIILDHDSQFYARPNGIETSFVGLPTQRWDLDPDETYEVDPMLRDQVYQSARQFYPWRRRFDRYGEERIGIDAYTEEGRGIFRPSRDVEGLFLLTGGSGGGFKVAPAVARKTVEGIRRSLI